MSPPADRRRSSEDTETGDSNTQQLKTLRQRGISPIIGVVLLIAIVVVLALAVFVISPGSSSSESPPNTRFTLADDGSVIHDGGETLNPDTGTLIVSGEEIPIDETYEYGDVIDTLSSDPGDTARIIWESSDGEQSEQLQQVFVGGQAPGGNSGSTTELTVAISDGPSSLKAGLGENVTVVADITNTGDQQQDSTVRFDVAGRSTQQQTVTLASGDSTTVSFDHTLETADAGANATISAGVNSSQRQLTVEGLNTIQNWNDLDDVRNGLDESYVLVNDLDSSTAGYDTHVANPSNGWDPIGGTSSDFTGTFDGNSNTISDLVIDRGSEEYVGLFGSSRDGGEISDATVTNADVTGKRFVGVLVGETERADVSGSSVSGSVNGGSSFSDPGIGGLVGYHTFGTVSDSSASVTVTGVTEVGGLIGRASGSTVTNSSASGDVSAIGNRIGGLLGYNGGAVTNSSASGTVTSERDQVGGLVGLDFGTVSNSSASGAVNGSDSVGGLVGSGDTVSDSFATGAVTGSGDVGGLAGDVDTVSDSYWDTEATGQSSGIGDGSGDVTGLTTSEMQGSSAETNMAGFDFTNVWKTVTGDYPELRSLSD